MSAVEGGVIRQTSVSQVESFDHNQKGGCERRWWFDRVQGLRPDQDDAQSEGDKGHELLAGYLRTGQTPEGRVKMGKAVRGAILKGELPKPTPDMLVEHRFSGQPKLDAEGKWIPLDESKTLVLGGVPWEGFIDLAFRREGELPEIWDHKFSSDIHLYAKQGKELIKTVQMPVYVLAMQRVWPDAEDWQIVHHNIARTGVDSFVRSAVVHIDEVLERKAHIEGVVERMKLVAPVAAQDDVPFNRKSCHAWRGCPHQSICSAFKEKKVDLSPEELELFKGVDGAPPPAPPTSVAAPSPVPTTTPVDDPSLPPPPTERKKREPKKKLMIEDQSTTPDSVPCDPNLVQGAVYRLPGGEERRFLCTTDGKYSFAALEGTTTPTLLEAGTPVVYVSAPAPTPATASNVKIPGRFHVEIPGRSAAASIPDSQTATLRVPPVVVVFELGPKTLAALAALTAKLG